jgi:hypothetical protein
VSENLQTLAEIAVALAGFSGVVIAFGGGIKGLPSFRLSLLLSLSGEVVFFSLVPLILLMKFDASLTWSIAGASYGLVHLGHVAHSFFRYGKYRTSEKRPLLDKALMSIGPILSLTLLYLGLLGSTQDTQFIYGVLLVFVLSVAGSQFFRLLMHLQRQTVENDV